MSLPDRLLLITNRAMARPSLIAVVERSLDAGCRWVLVREKDLSQPALRVLVEEVLALARPYGATVSVSANAEIAAASGAHGVHLPRYGALAQARRIAGPGALIGMSTHSLGEAQAAATAGAQYITLSPLFPTPSKPGYGPVLGLDWLHFIATRLPIPILALGGVTPQKVASCLEAGAVGVAVMGSVMRAPKPGAVIQEYLAALACRRDEGEPSAS